MPMTPRKGKHMLKPVDSGKTAPLVQTSPLPVATPDPTKIAVLLNRNARRVSERLARKMERIVGSDHMFFSRSLEEAESLTREIVQRGYGTVVCGGGDGTLARAINLVHHYVRESNAWRHERFQRYGEEQTLLEPPRFAFLKLGTGNGMKGVIGARNPVDDLRKLIEYAPGRTHTIPLIQHNEDRFFFGGLGYDSMLLNDYNALKQRTQNALLKIIMQNVTGYFVALFARTLPRMMFKPRETRLEAQVLTRGRAFYVDPRRGDASIEIEPGSTLFEGRARMISAATSPYFGYGMRIFPFSNIMPGMMHLRIATLGPLTTLANLPTVWTGTYRNPTGIMDFLVEDVHVDLAHPFPFQHSGDAQGLRSELDMAIAHQPLRMVDYYPPRPHG